MKKYHQLATRYITKKKTNSISVFISIALSLSILVALTMIIENIRVTEANKYVREFGEYDYRAVGVDKEGIEKLESKDYLDNIYYGQTVGIHNNVTPDGMDNIVEFYGLDKDIFDEMIDFKLLSGRLPENKNEIIINSYNISSLGKNYTIGDTINVELEVNRSYQNYEWFKRYSMVYGGHNQFNTSNPLNGDAMNEHLEKTIRENKEFTVVGIFEVSNKNYLWQQRAITRVDKESLGKDEKFDIYLNTNKNNVQEDLSETLGLKYIKQTMGNNYYGMDASEIKENGYTYLANKAAEQNTMLIIIVVIFCFLVVRNIINISISQKIKHYGVLRAIGANEKQLSVLIMKEIFIILLCAIPVGMALGFGFLYGVCEVFNSILGINYEIVVSMGIGTVLIILGIITSICLISSILVLRKEMMLTPIDAIQDSKGLRDKKVKRKNFLGQNIHDDDVDSAEELNEILTFEETTIKSKIMKTLFGFEGRLGHKNISRDRSRNNSCIISLTATMIIILMFIMQGITGVTGAKFTRSSDSWQLEFNNKLGIVNEDTIKLLSTIEGVENVYKNLYTMVQTTVKSDEVDELLKTVYIKNRELKGDVEELNLNINVRGLDESALELYKDYLLDGELTKDAIGDNGVILLSEFTNSYFIGDGENKVNYYAKYDLRDTYSVGDKIKIDGTDKEFEIKAIVSEDVLANNMNTHDLMKNTGDLTVLTTDDVFERLTGIKNSNSVLINTDRDDNKEVIKVIEEKFEGQMFTVTDEKAIQDEAREEVLETIGVNCIYAAIIIALVAVNLISTLAANILSRKGELAALRSIGMTGWQMSKMIVAESVAMVLSALTVVIPVAIIFMSSTQFSKGENVVFSNQTVVLMVVAVIAILSALAILISIVPLRIIKKANIVDTLKEAV